MWRRAEFWNVSTRPATARGGFGLTVAEAGRRLALIEKMVEFVTESPASYTEWRRPVVSHGMSGVQVHDARLVAVMRVERIDTLLTLNARDVARYSWL
jgi:predicted nucleic acid-binding protein